MDNEERFKARLRPGCICKGVRLYRLVEAIEAGATSFAEVAGQTGIGNGSCQGKRCGARVAELLKQLAPPDRRDTGEKR